MFQIRKYTPADKTVWDRFVVRSKNATFLFERGYMDYHADRFEDHSLLFFEGRRLYAVMPAHRGGNGTVFCTHLGLTYGGLLMDDNVTTAGVLSLFSELNEYLRREGFRQVVYRAIPWVYHRLPAEEDLYAMFWKCKARLRQRMSGTVIFMDGRLGWRKDHRRRLRLAQTVGIQVVAGGSLDEFWPILEDNLQTRFNTSPVHTLDEIKRLKAAFPDRIVQYNAYFDGKIVAGITFYVMGHLIHGQYSATSDVGKRTGAMEAIYEQVMYRDFAHMRYLDFGTSNEEGGRVLNEGLIGHKEGYGGRTVCYDTYEWEL